MIGERTEREEDEEEENIDLHKELDKDKRKRTRDIGRGIIAPKSKKKKIIVVKDNHDTGIKELTANKEEKYVDPKVAPKVMTQNLFSIFTSNVPGNKVRKRPKPQTKKPTVSNTKFKTIFNYFNSNDGKKDDCSC